MAMFKTILTMVMVVSIPLYVGLSFYSPFVTFSSEEKEILQTYHNWKTKNQNDYKRIVKECKEEQTQNQLKIKEKKQVEKNNNKVSKTQTKIDPLAQTMKPQTQTPKEVIKEVLETYNINENNIYTCENLTSNEKDLSKYQNQKRFNEKTKLFLVYAFVFSILMYVFFNKFNR